MESPQKLAPDLFRVAKLLVVKDAFNPEECLRLRSEARSVTGTPTAALLLSSSGKSSPYRVEQAFLRATSASITDETRLSVRDRLLSLKPRLERHFGVSLTDCERPDFRVYRRGDFVKAHPDTSRVPDLPERVKKRRVSAVVFLNSAAEETTPDSYGGGSLTFYRSLDDALAGEHGFPLIGQAGSFIAFRSDAIHEVTPVTHGERFTIVTWFF